MGLIAQDWCARITQAEINTWDTASLRWSDRVIEARKQIAGDVTPDLEYGSETASIDNLEEYVSDFCKRVQLP